jgi:hypothetical protein
MIEILFIVALSFGVLILFYRQAIEQYNILQIEATQLADLPKLLTERSPLVIRDVGAPKLFTPDILKQNPRLMSFPISKDMNLKSYLDQPVVGPLKMTQASSHILARETGLQVWAEHTWFSRFFSTSLWETIHSMKTEAHIGEKGLRKTTAIWTLLYPTSSTLEVTLLTERQGQFLPKVWRGRFPEAFTIQDTPLVGEIKYITIKVRPGTVLCVPTHWYISIRATESEKQGPILWCWMEVHNPISYLASKMETTLEV